MEFLAREGYGARMNVRVLAIVVVLSQSCGSSVTCGNGTALANGECVPLTTMTSTCGQGTTLQDGACVSVAQCGTGTVNLNGKCVPENPLTCGAGTTAQNGACVAALQSCGAGTVAQNGVCVAGLQTCGAGTTTVGTSCVATVQSCGAGTSAMGTSCVAAIQSCGAGTMARGTECVTQGLTCGAGTVVSGTQCNVNTATVCSTDTTASGSSCVGRVTCGAGTTRSADACLPQLSTLCGPGTRSANGRCELNPTACGTGTTLVNGQCVVPTPVPSFTTFTANPTLNVAYDHEDYFYMSGTRTYHRVIVTDLSAGNALSWATTQIAPVGTGSALHLKIDSTSLYTGSSITRSVEDARFQGACDTSLVPTELASTTSQTFVNFFGWTNSTPSMVVCGAAGSVLLERLTLNTVDTVRITFNVQFSDGTLWTDRVFTTPYR